MTPSKLWFKHMLALVGRHRYWPETHGWFPILLAWPGLFIFELDLPRLAHIFEDDFPEYEFRILDIDAFIKRARL